MNRKLNCVLLVDESDSTNYVNEKIVNRADITNKVVAKESGMDALEYLKTAGDDEYPELVFLDINMPGMNGWEFLDEYDKLDEKSKEGIIICMLTTSYATPDIEKAKSNDCIHSFISKPLTKEKLLTVLENIE